MLCKECTNKTYYPQIKKDSGFSGCGAGVPEFHPAAIAKQVKRKADMAVKEMEFDRAEYYREVIEEIQKTLNKDE